MALEQHEGENGSTNISERTPLLDGDSRPTDASAAEANQIAQAPKDDDDIPLAEEASTQKLIAIMGATFCGVFFAALDGTIVSTLAGPISSSFDSFSLLGWIASAYIIASATIQPLSGKLTDIFGRRSGLLTCYTLFAVGCLVCGFAPDAYSLIAGRIISGLGGGGMLSISVFIVSDLVPLRSRGLWQGIGNIIFGAAMCLGGVFGGFLNDRLNWRWAFWIQVPFIAISAVFVAMLIKIPIKDTGKNRIRRIDFPGAFLLTSALILLLLGIDLGGNHLGWKHPVVLVCLPLSAVFLCGFGWVEVKVAPEPMIPLQLLTRRTVAAACIISLSGSMGVMALSYYVPLFFQAQGLSATQAGARFIPQAIGGSLGSFGAGWMIRKLGSYYWVRWFGIVSWMVGVVLYQFVSFDHATPFIFTAMVFSGLGFGTFLTVLMTGLIAAVDQKDQATITSASLAFRQTGASAGVTVGSALFQNVLKSELWQRLGDRPGGARVIEELRHSLKAINQVPTSWKADVLQSYENAFHAVFYFVLGLVVIACVAGAFIKEHKLYSNLARK